MCSRTIGFTQYLCRTILFCHPLLVSVTLLVFLCLYQYAQYMSLNNIFIRDSAFILPFHWLLAMICYRTYARMTPFLWHITAANGIICSQEPITTTQEHHEPMACFVLYRSWILSNGIKTSFYLMNQKPILK